MTRRPFCRLRRLRPRRGVAWTGPYRGATWKRDPHAPRRLHLWETTDVYWPGGGLGQRCPIKFRVWTGTVIPFQR